MFLDINDLLDITNLRKTLLQNHQFKQWKEKNLTENAVNVIGCSFIAMSKICCMYKNQCDTMITLVLTGFHISKH